LTDLHLAWIEWFNDQEVAAEQLQPFSDYKLRDSERVNWSFHEVLQEQRRLIASIESQDEAKGPGIEAALRKWRASEIEAANTLRRVLAEPEIALDQSGDHTRILEIQEDDSGQFEQEERVLNQRVIAHMQEERKRMGLPPLDITSRAKPAEQ